MIILMKGFNGRECVAKAHVTESRVDTLSVRNSTLGLRPTLPPYNSYQEIDMSGGWPGEELHTFEMEFIPALEKVICHEIRIAVIPDCSDPKIYTVNPEK